MANKTQAAQETPPGGMFLGKLYNYPLGGWAPKSEEGQLFREIARPGDPAPDFTLPTLEGEQVTLSALRGKAVVMEFGNIT
jgi:cytochrome oxidase Cu insertion factor (SCO1/SenC/PrrC family)